MLVQPTPAVTPLGSTDISAIAASGPPGADAFPADVSCAAHAPLPPENSRCSRMHLEFASSVFVSATRPRGSCLSAQLLTARG